LPRRWTAGGRSLALAVLYLGSAKAADLDTDAEIVAINRKGELEPHQRGVLADIEVSCCWTAPGASQGAVVAQCLDAEMPARHPQSQAAVALWPAAPRAALRRALDHRGRRDPDRRPRKRPEIASA